MYVIVVDVKTATYDLLLDLISKLDILFGTYFLVKMRMFVLYMNSYIIFYILNDKFTLPWVQKRTMQDS